MYQGRDEWAYAHVITPNLGCTRRNNRETAVERTRSRLIRRRRCDTSPPKTSVLAAGSLNMRRATLATALLAGFAFTSATSNATATCHLIANAISDESELFWPCKADLAV